MKQKIVEDIVFSNGDLKPYEVYVTNDKRIIKKYASEIYALIAKSYEHLNGNASIHNVDDIVEKTSIAKIVVNNDSEIVAVALYRDDLGGHKRFTSASNRNDPKYLEAVQDIIKNDIEPYDNWYWVEASGRIEEFFKLHNGNPIPNYLVHKFLRKPKCDIVELAEDGVHYKRFISPNDSEPTQKAMYGFKDKSSMDRVMRSIDNYGQFKIDVNNAINDLFEDEVDSTEDDKTLEAASIFIQELDEKHDAGFNEMLPSWKEQLKMSIARFLREQKKSKLPSTIKEYIDANLKTAKYLIKKMPILKVHQFKMDA